MGWGWKTLVVSACLQACSAAPVSVDPNRPKATSTSKADPTTESDASSPSADEAPSTTPLEGPLAVVVIDVQKVFFDTAAKRSAKVDPAAIQTRTAHLLSLASQKQVPIFVSFEESKTGDHALPPTLASALPTSAGQFIKTTFDATGQAQLLAAVKGSGAKRVVALGAETDVCVMQTVLGLRRAGFDVITVDEATFTEEVNDGPAFRRMKQAGIVDLPIADVEKLLESGGRSPAPTETHAATTAHPFEVGILLHDLEGFGGSDANSSQKTVRLRELLLVSEWFELPVFAENPSAATAALPASLRSLVKRPIRALAARPSSVKQMAVAGARADIATIAATLAKAGDVFVVEDALIGQQDLESLYVAGAMPSTYKSLYYELIHSVSEAEWPSQKWVSEGTRFYWNATMAPEELPPLGLP